MKMNASLLSGWIGAALFHVPIACAGFLAAFGSVPAGAGSFGALFSFDNADGANPAAGLLMDAKGALYGTALGGATVTNPNCQTYFMYPGCGIVFKLSPPAAGRTQWRQSVLYGFQGGTADGANPSGNLVADAGGALYGTTQSGGAFGLGTVFKLLPPVAPATQWTETVLYSFEGGADGASPFGDLIFDASGALYGTTTAGGPQGAGTVFQLMPPSGPGASWTESVLYAFQGGTGDGAMPSNALTVGSGGVLYGTAAFGGSSGQGVLFELVPPQAPATQWTETVLFDFDGAAGGGNPSAGVTFGFDGALYGAAPTGGGAGWGVVFRLAPPGPGETGWTETVLHSFTGQTDGGYPNGPLTFGKDGSLYGLTTLGDVANGGVLFKLSPPASGQANWRLTTLYKFGTNQNLQPYSVAQNNVIFGPDGSLYGAAFEQGREFGGYRYGEIFKY
jgi:uncharacterized repeat protein (TIGR03803 family)